MTAEIAQLHSQALQHYAAGARAETDRVCREILRLDPLQPDAVYLLGVLALDAGRADEALLHFHHAALLRPGTAAFLNGLGEAYRSSGRREEAGAAFREAIRLDPALPAAHNALGNLLMDLGDANAAIASFRAAIAARPDYERAYLNLGRALQMQGALDEAGAAYEEALRLRPRYSIACNNLGALRLVQGRPAEAVEHLQRAIEVQSDYPEAHANLGSAYAALGDPGKSCGHFQRAIQHRPNYARAHHGLGQALESVGEYIAAVRSYREAIRHDPKLAAAHESLGNLLLLQPDLEGARAALERALELDPANAHAFSRLVYTRQMLCDWRNRDADLARLWSDAEARIAAGEATPVSPLNAVMLPWSAARQLAVARSHSRVFAENAAKLKGELAGEPLPPMAEPGAAAGGRLRIGYLSNEFRDHAVSHLVQGVFELHDRERFEVFGYSFGVDDGSSYRKRIAAGCEHFRDLREKSLTESARAIRGDRLHVLVDLQGYAGFPRMALMAQRLAPIQVNYLGHPGTTGADFIDYLIGDPVVTPAAHAADYPERLVRLPNCYLATDHTQPIAADAGSRADHGLPEKAVVFCAFNTSYKLEPRGFDVWMRILHRVPGSVLWLSPAAGAAAGNLLREAAARGVPTERIVFARRMPGKAEHLARHKLADLFLDTLDYNGHTTGCDALWAGLPVLTCPGETFASRVGASMLTAIGLGELIARDLESYERLAVELAQDPQRLQALRDKLARQRTAAPLFDTPRLVRNLEAAYEEMWRRRQTGGPPRAIDVATLARSPLES